MPSPPARLPHVLIAGGGVAALEALIALRDLADGQVRVTLLTPAPDFVYRPMAVAEPFGLGRATRHPVAAIVADAGAELVPEALASVDPDARTVTTTTGTLLGYDSLLLAVGARYGPAFDHALTFGADGAPDALAGLLGAIGQHEVRDVAFVVPVREAWNLPLYELALLTARDAASAGAADVRLRLVTPEHEPLEIFGGPPGAMVRRLLDAAGIELVLARSIAVRAGVVIADGHELHVDRIVSLPVATGPRVPGMPGDADGFLPVDPHGRVPGTDGVFAAGDSTAMPIKQGGLAAQMAVAAAESIAARHGADLEPRPFRPVLRGMLLASEERHWLRAPAAGTWGESKDSPRALWWPPTKIASKYLAPYLVGAEGAELLRSGPTHAHVVDRDLELLAAPRGKAR